MECRYEARNPLRFGVDSAIGSMIASCCRARKISSKQHRTNLVENEYEIPRLYPDCDRNTKKERSFTIRFLFPYNVQHSSITDRSNVDRGEDNVSGLQQLVSPSALQHSWLYFHAKRNRLFEPFFSSLLPSLF